ncbi:MAG: T9SS type A sorting domain-containing protein [bacterium]|nr:T9SS type A sorting domain-containing protein [bacterium]
MRKLIFGLLAIFISTIGSAQIEIIDTIRIAPKAGNGIRPTAVALNPNTNKAYIVNYETNNVSVIDVLSNSVISVIPNIWEGYSIAINNSNNRIYVLGNDGVSIIDGNSDTLLTTISLPDPEQVIEDWRSIAVNPNTNRIYLTDGYGSVCVIDGITNSFIKKISTGDEEDAIEGIVVDLKVNKIYVTSCNTNEVFVIDALTDSLMDTINVGKRPIGVTVSPSTGYVYVSNYDTTTISVINDSTDSVVATIEIDSTLSALTADSDYIYVTSLSNNKVYVIDGTTNSVVDTIGVEYFPCGICATPAINYVYVVNRENNSVSVINRNTCSVDTSIVVGCKIWGDIGINSNTNRIYVGDGYGRNLFVIDGTTNKILKRISTDMGINDISVDSIRNKIYVDCGDGIDIIDGATDSITGIMDNIPSVICVNSITGRAYIATVSNIKVMDTGSDSIIAVIPVKGPIAIALDINTVTNRLYALYNDSIFIIDGATNCVIDTTVLKYGGYDISINPVTNYIYAGCIDPGYISVIDGVGNNIVDTIQVGVFLHTITVNPSLNRIYAGKFNVNADIYAINGATNSIMGQITVGDCIKAIALNTANNYLYAGSFYDGAVWVLNDALGVEESPNSTSTSTSLRISQNPFSKSTIINYYLPANVGQGFSLAIYDLTGRLIKTLAKGEKPAGPYSISLSANELKTGIYFVRLTAGISKTTKKITIIK